MRRTRRDERFRGLILRTVAAATVACSALATPASADRGGLSGARAELMRVHAHLVRDAAADPAVLAARDAAGRACADLYQVRQNALAKVYATSDYVDLRLALWGKQRQLQGLYVEMPVRSQLIMARATDALSIRAEMTRLEASALERDDAYVEARDDATAKVTIYQQARRDAFNAVRTSPEFLAVSQRVQSMQRSITGYRTSVASAQ